MAVTAKDENAVSPTLPAKRIVRLPEVKALTGLSRSTVYERIREGQFPKPVGLGGRNVGWVEGEVTAWIERRIAIARGHVS
ncbi:AlpA family transcriptional regulator [Asticcacaulis sp. DXS10W]|uniref:AlpA family transcriptional regulator n=1 Tax=Asticcacaulis currens TaxID=2984210 RepID=A0ABT5IBA8_9CAUL|nr:AlpA family transcriptional regulator [Asticcacaulis currens]MDC7693471.1 AlpA family transcriptional regulator [Asticcacaulis currens]